MVGQEFGKLKVVRRHGNTKQWLCICACGNQKRVKECNLLNGHTASCGCQKKHTSVKYMVGKAIDANRKLKVGMVFGRLRITGTYPTKATCECGNTIGVKRTASLFNGDLKSCGCLNSENASAKARKILTAYRVSKGVHPDTVIGNANKVNRLAFGRHVGPKILERDDYTCALCKCRGGRLNVHHIFPWGEAPELRFDETNLITLCEGCHVPIAHKGNVRGKVCQETQAKLLSKIKELYADFPDCGAKHDRDVNAARNILNSGLGFKTPVDGIPVL